MVSNVLAMFTFKYATLCKRTFTYLAKQSRFNIQKSKASQKLSQKYYIHKTVVGTT